MNADPYDYFIRLLGLPEEHTEQLKQYIEMLERSTGETGVLERAQLLHQEQWSTALMEMGLEKDASAESILGALREKMEIVDNAVWEYFQSPDLSTEESWQSLLDTIRATTEPASRSGFFMKHDVARGLLRAHPPQEIIDYFGYEDVEELLSKEKIEEVYSALRFGVSGEWNDGFLKLYANLTPEDFEEREVVYELMDPGKWFELAREFAKKKLHPNSHLKEMGIIFAIPNPEAPKEGLRRTLTTIVSLMLHYHYEVNFYGKYIKQLQTSHSDEFGKYLQQMIMGEVLVETVPANGVRISHQYYTKKDEPKPIGYEPHVMPEPLHWHKGRELLHAMLQDNGNALQGWSSWYTSGQVVDGMVISLNFEDNVVSGDKHKTYHLYEVLWNDFYEQFYPLRSLEEQFIQNMDTGLIPLT